MHVVCEDSEALLKYADMDKDGKIDDDFEKKIALAKMLMEEDRWETEKQERDSRLSMEREDRLAKAAEAQQLQQMLNGNNDFLSQFSIEEG